MYYPFLRARQFELIALRELVQAEEITNTKIFPILEPVKSNFNSLNLALKVFKDKRFQSYLICNSSCSEDAPKDEAVISFIKTSDNIFLPAFYYDNNCNYILETIEEYSLNSCLLICSENFLNEDDLKEISKCEEIVGVVLQEPNKYRSLDKFFKELGKKYIRLDDLFEKKQRNSDFLGIQAHKFTEEHLYFKDDGYDGFSDFTILPSEFVEGGSTPRAVVIHLTYPRMNENVQEIWISHFTSNTNDSISNVQGKFYEAAEKAVKFCEDSQISNSAIEELKFYFESKKYPGLGTVKKVSVKNHLLVINQVT